MQREEWFHRAVIYQVDSSLFYDANGDGFGDLAGIRQKLHYIRSLGATVLWLTPFYLTPLQDDGYDISDHLQPDPRFGTIADVIELIARARELGLRVIVELVIQHTSAQHPWFRRRDAIPGRRGGRIICGRIGRRKTTILPCFPALRRASGAGTNRLGNIIATCFITTSPT